MSGCYNRTMQISSRAKVIHPSRLLNPPTAASLSVWWLNWLVGICCNWFHLLSLRRFNLDFRLRVGSDNLRLVARANVFSIAAIGGSIFEYDTIRIRFEYDRFSNFDTNDTATFRLFRLSPIPMIH